MIAASVQRESGMFYDVSDPTVASSPGCLWSFQIHHLRPNQGRPLADAGSTRPKGRWLASRGNRSPESGAHPRCLGWRDPGARTAASRGPENPRPQCRRSVKTSTLPVLQSEAPRHCTSCGASSQEVHPQCRRCYCWSEFVRHRDTATAFLVEYKRLDRDQADDAGNG